MIAPDTHEVERIFHSTLGNGTRVVGLTSPVHGSGVTTLAVSLASRCFLGGIETLLVDMASPVMAAGEATSWTPERGGAGQEIDVNPNGFDRLPIRASTETMFKFRDPAALREVFAEELVRYGAIIIDLPPVPLSKPAAVPGAIGAASCDSVLLVSLNGRVDRRDLDAAINELKAANAPLSGLVLNERDNPTLGDEIAREARRIERFFPRFSRYLQRLAKRIRFLNMQM